MVGIGDMLDETELYAMASLPKDENVVFMAPSWQDLPNLVTGVAQAMCDGKYSTEVELDFCHFGNTLCDCRRFFISIVYHAFARSLPDITKLGEFC